MAERGLERARAAPDPVSAEAASAFEEALAVLRRSKAILEGVADGVYITDPTGRIRLWNRSVERLTGHRERKALGRSCGEMVGLRVAGEPLDCSAHCALLAACHGGVEVEAEREPGGGKTQSLLVSASAVDGPDGELAEVVHSLRDITAMKLADEAKTMFLATASHELKTPLTVILGFVQLLQGGILRPEQHEPALDAIEKRAKELNRIVDRLLLTARIEAGRATLNIAIVDIRPLVAERTTELTGAVERRIVLDAPDVIPPIVGDGDAITTVFDHLLDNAVKYSPSGEDVHVSLQAHGSTVEIAVVDQGVGMSPEEVRRCFDRFWQAESSDVRRFGGTGVGLYIVRSLVEGMDGSIDVRSVPGEGTTFTIRFRAATDKDAAQLARAVGPEQAPGVGKPTMIHEFMRQIGVPSGGGGS